MKGEAILTTVDLALEPLLPSHAVELYDGLRDDRIYLHIPQSPPASQAALMERFLKLSARRSPDGRELWLNWALRRKDGECVGWVQATVHGDRSALVAWIVFPTFWRKGYATQACRQMLDYLRAECDVVDAIATVDAENVASIRLLEKLGFARVSTEKAADMEKRLEHRYEKML
jgi:RimJ/RimL family protein N-acetyltransferase